MPRHPPHLALPPSHVPRPLYPAADGAASQTFASLTVTGQAYVGSLLTDGPITSTLPTGSAPLVVASTTLVENLNADLLDGQHGSFYQDPTNLTGYGAAGGYLRSTGAAWARVTVASLLSDLLTVDGAGSGLDADLLDGNDSAFYQSSSNQNAGTLPSGRLTGAYGGITGVGTLASGAVPASLVTAGTFGAGAYTFPSTLLVTGRTGITSGLYIGTNDTSADAALLVGTGYTYTTAANLFGIRSDSIFPGTATGQGFAGYFRFRSANTAFTMTAGYGVRIETPVIGAASTITTGYGLHINNQTWTGSTNAYGIYVGNVSGASGAAYGLRIFDQTGSGVNYALYTGAGLVRFGDRVDINASITAAAGAARALYLTPTLTASANGDNMTAVSISPTFSVGGFTGTVVSGLNIGPITGGATNYAIRVANPISSTLATGTAPFAVTSTTVCTNLNADLLDGQHGSYYNDAANLTGTVASARLSGSYTGITGVGTLAAGAIPASLITAGTFGTGDYTFDSNIVLSATNAVIRANTADGSDSHSITIAGGGGTGNSRGGYIKVYGNESAVFGDVEIISGNAFGSDVTITAFGQIGLNGAVYVNGTLTGNGIVRANTEIQSPSLDTIGATDLLINRNNVLQLTIGSLLATFAGDVTVASGKVYKVNGTQVVAARITGYTNAMTGTADRATSYDTSTITLQQLAERVKALEDDLITHGLIGV